MARTWPALQARCLQQLRHHFGIQAHQSIGRQRPAMDLVRTGAVEIQQRRAQGCIKGPMHVCSCLQQVAGRRFGQHSIHAIQRGARHQPDKPGHGR
jgi:hypothetical protein